MDSFTLDKIEFDAVRRLLCDFAACSLGKSLAMHIGPSRNPQVIAEWLESVTQMVRAVRDFGLPPFGGVTDITPQLERAIPGGGVTGEDFAAIAAALEGAGNVRAYLASLPEQLEHLHSFAHRMSGFDGEIAAIRRMIDNDGTVRDDASTRLAAIRRDIDSKSRQIHDVIYGYLRSGEVKKLLQHATVTLHGDRYVLPVKAENRGRLPGVVHRSSQSGATVFVEPSECVQLNNQLSDLMEDERHEVQRLLNELSVRVHARVDDITAALRLLAQIDLLSAKAQYSYQFDMTCPQVGEHGPVLLTQARHPLLIEQAWRQEQAGVPADKRHEVVPIDVRLGQDFDILVITGSNTGGKTVALKTVALLAVMAQSGMHIPAQRGAVLPVFHNIFIDVGDEQSLEQSLSTFGAHMHRVRFVLSKADKQSLVLLDELGSGTDPDEGGAIGQAVLDELRRIGCMAMVTTHLSILKAYAYNHDRVDNASVEFDVATMRPTYRLQIGTPGESHAIAVAQRLGLPRRVVASARQHLGSQGKQFRRAIQATSQARQVAEDARNEAQAARVAAEVQQETYESKLADLHRLREEFEHWLATLPELQTGDTVFVPSLKKQGTLVRMELHRQIALVNADGVHVEVPLKDLMPDLGQAGVRQQIAQMRKQILDQAAAAQQQHAEAQRLHEEYQKSLAHQRQRARQFDQWLGAIARLKVGDDVPIARKPGRGKVTAVDLPALKVTVQTSDGEISLSLQDVFPTTGPFARHEPAQQHGGAQQRGGRGAHARDRGDKQGQQQPPPKDRPVEHRSPTSKAAKASREALLEAKGGEQVWVVPFQKKATLIRVLMDKDLAVVQSGAFELEVPLADVEPLGNQNK